MSHFILAVERDRDLLQTIRGSLVEEGFQVITAGSRGDALARAAAWMPGAALLGTGFGPDTVDLVRELRREHGLRIAVLARANENALVSAALESGAMGFVKLPATRSTLAERVREMLAWRSMADGRFVTAGPVTLDLARRSLVKPRAAALTPCEFEIVRWLVTTPGRTFTRRQLLATDRAAFPPHATGGLVDRHVASLQRKLGEAGGLIEPSGDLGWRFVLRPEDAVSIEFPLTNVAYDV